MQRHILLCIICWYLIFHCRRAGLILMYKTRKVRTDQFGESGWVIGILIVVGVSS